MNRELFAEFVTRSYAAIIGAVLLGAGLMLMSGCTTIAGKPARETGNRTAGLTGKWYKSSRFEYARYAGNLGDFESFEITSDGRVKAESLKASREFDCIVEVSAKSEGTLRFAPNAQELNIDLAAGQTRKTNSCSSAKTATAETAATSTDYQWKLAETENGATDLCLTARDGKTNCYRRED